MLSAQFGEKATGTAHDLAGFVDPFSTASVDKILIWMRKPFSGSGNMVVEATIYFASGETKGEHVIKADTLEQVIPRVKSFLEGIKR